MRGKDWVDLLWPLVCAVLMVATFYSRGEYLDPLSLAIGSTCVFFLGLVVKTKGERLIIEKLDRMKKEIDELKEEA
jgi:hypothetical protein